MGGGGGRREGGGGKRRGKTRYKVLEGSYSTWLCYYWGTIRFDFRLITQLAFMHRVIRYKKHIDVLNQVFSPLGKPSKKNSRFWDIVRKWGGGFEKSKTFYLNFSLDISTWGGGVHKECPNLTVKRLYVKF